MPSQASPHSLLDILSPESIQVHLDALAVMSFKYAIVIAAGSLMPMHPDIDGYHITPGGCLFAYQREERASIVVAGNLHASLAKNPRRTFVSDMAAMSAHDRIRILRDLRCQEDRR